MPWRRRDSVIFHGLGQVLLLLDVSKLWTVYLCNYFLGCGSGAGEDAHGREKEGKMRRDEER
jgi:hypothetical protein